MGAGSGLTLGRAGASVVGGASDSGVAAVGAAEAVVVSFDVVEAHAAVGPAHRIPFLYGQGAGAKGIAICDNFMYSLPMKGSKACKGCKQQEQKCVSVFHK